MTDAFEAWINSMSDNEYEDMLDDPDGFTDAQEEKALNIRSRPEGNELEELEKEQEFVEPEQQVEQQTPRITIQETEQEFVRVEPTTEPIGVDLPDRSFVPRERPALPKVEPPRPEPRKVTERVRQAVQSTGKFLRRFFRV